MLMPHGAVVVLADGAKLELHRNQGDEIAPDLTPLPAPSLGHENKSSGGRHFSSSANPDRRQLTEDAHAAAVVEWLDQQVLGHAIAKFAVIAPPRTLGEMRQHYSKRLQDALLFELSKDLMGRSGSQILEALRAR